MEEKLSNLKQKIKELCENPQFIHYRWFVKWHLEILERMVEEAFEFYPEANKELVRVLVWSHDYGTIMQHDSAAISVKDFLKNLGFDDEFINLVLNHIDRIDNAEDFNSENIEVKILSSCDAASHMVGPFYQLWWYDNPNKSVDELVSDNQKKTIKDWDRKMVIPEIRKAFESRHKHTSEISGNLPDKFFS